MIGSGVRVLHDGSGARGTTPTRLSYGGRRHHPRLTKGWHGGVSSHRLWLVLAILATGCHRSDETKAPDRPVPADQVLDFATLYGKNCAGCHGANGKLGPAPPLNDPIFLAIVPDEVVAEPGRRGRPGTPMPAFAQSRGGPLTDDQVKALAAGIKPTMGPGPTDADRSAALLRRDDLGGRRQGTRHSRSSPAPVPLPRG